MPRNGSGVYSLPANTAAVANETISSAKFNTLTADIAADLNAERPISAGGTGAGTAADALDNLGALDASENLSDLGNAATARSNLGVGDNFQNASTVEDADANNMVNSGLYDLRSSAANLPESSFYSAIVTKSGSAGDMIAQLLMRRNGAGAYLRTVQAGVWNADRKFMMDNDKADQATAEAGKDDVTWVSPLGVKQAIVAQGAKALQFIETVDASNDSVINFTGFDSSEFESYQFVLSNVIPSVDGASLLLRTSREGVGGYDSGASDYSYTSNWGASSALGSSAADAAAISGGGVGNGAGEYGVSGTIECLSPHLSTVGTQFSGTLARVASDGNFNAVTLAALRNSASATDAVRFLFSTGNIASGTITMYGRRNA